MYVPSSQSSDGLNTPPLSISVNVNHSAYFSYSKSARILGSVSGAMPEGVLHDSCSSANSYVSELPGEICSHLYRSMDM